MAPPLHLMAMALWHSYRTDVEGLGLLNRARRRQQRNEFRTSVIQVLVPPKGLSGVGACMGGRLGRLGRLAHEA